MKTLVQRYACWLSLPASKSPTREYIASQHLYCWILETLVSQLDISCSLALTMFPCPCFSALS
jgi:hypothetical protein